jgi:hypothetical protein
MDLKKCAFKNKDVSYPGFTLTPEGIKPKRDKLKAIKQAKPPTDVKTNGSFVGLCNFFWRHTKDFAISNRPARITNAKEVPWTSTSRFLQTQLVSEPVMVFP